MGRVESPVVVRVRQLGQQYPEVRHPEPVQGSRDLSCVVQYPPDLLVPTC